MPSELDNEEQPTKPRKPAGKFVPRPQPTGQDAEGSSLKPLLITFGAVLVAFGAIMAFVVLSAPKVGQVVIGDPPPTGGPFLPPGGDPSPPVTPQNNLPVQPDANAPQPDDWTPPAYTRPVSTLAGAKRITFTPDTSFLPLRWGSSPDVVYLDQRGLVFAIPDNNRSTLIGYDEKTRATISPPAELKPQDGVGSLTASADQSAVFASGNGILFRYLTLGPRKWETAPIKGIANYLAISTDRILAMEQRFKDTQFRLYRWPVGSREITLTARWEVAGGTAAATYDAAAGALWVVHATNPNAIDSKLERFQLSGRGGNLQASIPLPFPIGAVAPPVLSPDGRRIYVKDRAVEGDRLLPTKYSGDVMAAVGGVVFLAGSGYADSETGVLLDSARNDVYKLAWATDGASLWAADHSNKTVEFRRFKTVVGGGGPPLPPTPSVKVTELASIPGSQRAITAFRVSEKHGLLMYNESVTGLIILDIKTSKQLELPPVEGKARLRAIDLAPDESFAFATDGVTLHRLDLAARKWESRPYVGTRVMAMDDTTVLVQQKASNPATWALVKWEVGRVKELARMEWAYLYELGYDSTAKALYALHSKVNNTGSAVLERYAPQAGAGFISVGSKPFPNATPRTSLRPFSGDGRYFVQNMRASPTDMQSHGSVTFNEIVTGTVGTFAVGGSGQLYSVETGQLAGKLPSAADSATATDGKSVWVSDRTRGKFIKYTVEPVKK